MLRFRRALAFLAAFLTGIAPVLAYAHPALVAGWDYAEVCTDAGIARMPADGSGTPLAHAAHCALCIAPATLLAPGRAAPPLPEIGRVERPSLDVPPRPTPVEPVRAAHPRGPPTAPSLFA
jgi:hypothetical protein